MITVGTPAHPGYSPWASPYYRGGKLSGMIDDTLTSAQRFAIHKTLLLIPEAHRAKSADPSPWTSYVPAWETYLPLTMYFSGSGVFQQARFYPGTQNYYQPALTGSSPAAQAHRALFLVDVDTTLIRRSNLDPAYEIHPTLLHEYGHHVDAEGRWFTDGVWRTVQDQYPTPALTYRPEWAAIYAALRAKPVPSEAGRPFLSTYYYANESEWFAELYMMRSATNLKPGETFAYVSTTGGAQHRCHPFLPKFWCQGDAPLYNDMMQLFSATFPALSTPSPAWDGFGAPT